MSEPRVAEVDVSASCEHGTFSIQVSTPGVWHFPGAGRIETEAEDFFVFHPGADICECWEPDDE